eukprot:TRINITY_DN94573_c0_g1_i1.p1 TRINITY_DN94573_c0_g1~~TRINITY_DN94573_c0_g1_i1.p1  ORF type:complete len:603 (+),score=77.01 TRINITY_DN94573_c0_g1_i1:62-1870(+)
MVISHLRGACVRRRLCPGTAFALHSSPLRRTCEQGRFCSGRTIAIDGLPPGVLRLGLSSADLEGTVRAAQEDGPAAALSWLCRRNYLQSDDAQQRAALPMDIVWRSARAYAAEFPAWQKSHELWEAECARLRAEHQQLQELRRSSAKASSRSGTDDEKARKEEAEVKEEPLVLPVAPRKPELTSRGCYMWGEVGRGKTLLMDLLVLSLGNQADHMRQNSLGVEVQRVHFHGFMHGIHKQLHALRSAGAHDGLAKAAEEATTGAPSVLCFDEFQITTIADATLLTPLVSKLFEQDAIIVMTSNRAPDQLFQKERGHDSRMLDFDAALRSKLEIHYLDAPLDYRQVAASSSSPLELGPDYHVAAGAAREPLEAAFTSVAGSSFGAEALPVAWGRTLRCEQVGGGAARFTFKELCGQPLGAEDYISLIQRGGIHTFVVSDVPRFGVKRHNEARRFTNLVDALYEHQCRLVCTAEAPIDDLLKGMDRLCAIEAHTDQAGRHEAASENSMRQHRHGDVTFASSKLSPCRPDTFATAEADAEAGTSFIRLAGSGSDSSDQQDGVEGVMTAAIDSLKESGFAARRCASRLREMGTVTYREGHAARWGLH